MYAVAKFQIFGDVTFSHFLTFKKGQSTKVIFHLVLVQKKGNLDAASLLNILSIVINWANSQKFNATYTFLIADRYIAHCGDSFFSEFSGIIAIFWFEAANTSRIEKE